MRHSAYFIVTLFISLLIATLTGCGGHSSEAWKSMDVAESIIEEHPDSSYQILQSIESSSLKGDEERARYALLMSMALDKNYIDTTTFDVLQPAIDYYLKKGTPDQKMRTLYYQGRIYHNAGDDDNAMDTYVKARDYVEGSKDTVIMSRLLTAQGTFFHKQYKFKEFTENALMAASLNMPRGRYPEACVSYAKALNGAILQGDKHLADSILPFCYEIMDKAPDMSFMMQTSITMYILTFGTEDEIRSELSKYDDKNLQNVELTLDIAWGYYRIGDGKSALKYLEKVDTTYYPSLRNNPGGVRLLKESLKYLSIKAYILAKNNMFQEAYNTQHEYSRRQEVSFRNLLRQDALFAEKKHELESAKLREARQKDRVVWISIIVMIVSALIIGWQKYRNRLLSVREALAAKEKEQARLEADNYRLRSEQLEREMDDLKTLSSQESLPAEVSDAVKERIEMLNALLAEKITDNDSYSRSYSKWIDTVTSDREKFMNSTRLAFKASHPKFIEYLESHDLTESEINYLCLYAIGLRGKEVGEYIQLKRHYHISSEIRSKLGIDEHETNIGIYVRKLLRQL